MTAKTPEPAKTTEAKRAESMSALRTQRDAHMRRNTRLETENRLLRRHQEDIRTWLADAIKDFEAARNTEQVLEVADRIHRMATEKLGDANGIIP